MRVGHDLKFGRSLRCSSNEPDNPLILINLTQGVRLSTQVCMSALPRKA